MQLTRRTLMKSAAATIAAPSVIAFSTSARAAEFSFKYGNQVPATHPVTVGFQKAADRIKTETGGRVEINVFANSALGGDTDMLSQLRSGALEFFLLRLGRLDVAERLHKLLRSGRPQKSRAEFTRFGDVKVDRDVVLRDPLECVRVERL